MWPNLIVILDPAIQIRMQLFECMVHLLAERDMIKLVEHRFVKALAHAVLFWGSWTWYANDRFFRPRGKARIRAAPGCRNTRCAAVGQHTLQLDVVLFEGSTLSSFGAMVVSRS